VATSSYQRWPTLSGKEQPPDHLSNRLSDQPVPRQQILDRHPYSALKTFAKLSYFKKPLAKFVHKQFQDEAFKARQNLSSNDTFTRSDLEDFSMGQHYAKLLANCPLLMSGKETETIRRTETNTRT